MNDQPETDEPAGQPLPQSTPAAGDTTEPPAKPHGFIRRHWLALLVLVVVAGPGLVFTIWAGIALQFSYSDGQRAGFIQKLSRKGWVCKTWEGELAISAFPGQAPQLFTFTVRSDSVASEIQKLQGNQVSIHYREHPGVPSSCFGETRYFVDGVGRVSR